MIQNVEGRKIVIFIETLKDIIPDLEQQGYYQNEGKDMIDTLKELIKELKEELD